MKISTPRQVPSPVQCLGIKQWQINENPWFFMGMGFRDIELPFSHMLVRKWCEFQICIPMKPWGSTQPHELNSSCLVFREGALSSKRRWTIVWLEYFSCSNHSLLDGHPWQAGSWDSNLVKQWEGGTGWALSPTLGLMAHSASWHSENSVKQKVGS